MKTSLFAVCCALALVVGCKKAEDTPVPNSASPDTKEPAKETASAFTPVSDILTKSCVGCHNSTKPADGIDLSSYEAVIKGGKEGPIVVAGDPAKSILAMSLKGEGGIKKMPLKGDPLTEAQIKTIEDWIKDGAKK